MTGEDRLRKYIEKLHCRFDESTHPIFEIALFEHPNREMIFTKNGNKIPSGYPDAPMNNMGFYYELSTAIQALNENWADIQEHCFHAGFIFCRFPGLYNSVGPDGRIYFLWDDEREGFFEAEEPEIFKHIAY